MKSTSEGIAVAGVTVQDLRPWRRSRRRLIEAGRNPHGLEESGLFEHATLQLFAPLALQCEEPLFAAERLRFRSEEHTSELQSLMRISYAVFCLKKKHSSILRTHLRP